MRRIALSGSALLAAVLVAAPARGQAGFVVTVGSQGPGLALSLQVHDQFNVRAAGNIFSYSLDGEELVSSTNVGYETDAKLRMFGGILDFHPGGGGFHLSGGVFYNGNEGEGTVRLLDSYEVFSRLYTPEEIGTLTMKVSFDKSIAPYAGLGFGRATSGGRVGFAMDIGALYVGSPTVDLTGTGALAPTAQEGPQIEENLSWVEWYPVLSLGLTVRLSN